MSIARIARRYAKSLFELAKEAGKLNKVHEDILYVRKVAVLPDFDSVMRNPLVKEDKKDSIFLAVFGHIVDKLTLNTLMVMAAHNRAAYLLEVCRTFHLMYNEEKHVSSVTITLAEEMNQTSVDAILSEFKAKGLIESEVELKRVIDPAIIGGFILQFNDRVYNASVAYKLEQLRTKFSENLYIKNI